MVRMKATIKSRGDGMGGGMNSKGKKIIPHPALKPKQ